MGDRHLGGGFLTLGKSKVQHTIAVELLELSKLCSHKQIYQGGVGGGNGGNGCNEMCIEKGS